MAPRFLTTDEVLALHGLQVRLFGGATGTRDRGLLESAAAAYLFGICRNHPFVDGNKRAAAAAALTFLDLNGTEIQSAEGRIDAERRRPRRLNGRRLAARPSRVTGRRDAAHSAGEDAGAPRGAS